MEDYIAAHEFSFNNMPQLRVKQQCGCFYCRRIFSSEEISEYVADTEGTALCPYCGIDSVIGENSGYPVTKQLLDDMQYYWFF